MTFLIVLASVSFVLGVCSICFERRDWNGGQCRKCGGGWEYFDTDSQGGRGYKCKCGEHIWISYPLIDRRKQR